jgi:hypothetical protein
MALLEPFQVLVEGPAPTSLATVQERITAALAQLEGLQVAAPRYMTSAERRRYRQIEYAVVTAREALLRVKRLAE